MNIILFEMDEIDRPLPRSDPRVVHVLDVLRREIGSSTDVGIVNGARGKAILRSVAVDEVSFDFSWHEVPKPLQPIDLIVGVSRPQTCRKVLLEATSMGVRRMFFVKTDRGETSYATSKLWTTDEWQRLVRAGVEQAFSTHVPEIIFGVPIEDVFDAVATAEALVCLDNYEAQRDLFAAIGDSRSVVLALGSERGWSERERNLFRDRGYCLASLGERPLRTETAVVAATGIVLSQLGNQANREG